MRDRGFKSVAVLCAARPAQGCDWSLVPLLGPRRSLLDGMKFFTPRKMEFKGWITDYSKGNLQGITDDEVHNTQQPHTHHQPAPPHPPHQTRQTEHWCTRDLVNACKQTYSTSQNHTRESGISSLSTQFFLRPPSTWTDPTQTLPSPSPTRSLLSLLLPDPSRLGGRKLDFCT